MNVAILKLATSRAVGVRRWGDNTVRAFSPSRHHLGWFCLEWEVEGGKRGVDYVRHKHSPLVPRNSLSYRIARDLADGTNYTNCRRPL